MEIGDSESIKITDKYCYCSSSFGSCINYYDEKENEIKSENDIINGKYFYLDDNKFAICDEANNIYLIDVKNFSKIKINSKKKISTHLEKICYMEYNGLEYLIFILYQFKDQKSRTLILKELIKK